MNTKRKICITATIAVVVLLLALYVGYAFSNFKSTFISEKAEAENETNESSYYDMEDDFTDDKVLVVLLPSASRFAGISEEVLEGILSFDNVGEIENLTEFNAEYVNEDGSLNKEAAPELYGYYLTTPFHQILCVNLITTGKQNVLDLVSQLQELSFVEHASPNMIETTC